MSLMGFRVLGIRAFLQKLTSLKYCHPNLSFCSAAVNSGDSCSPFTVKKVTLSNFWSVLEDLRTQIREADFVAVDLEMTGLKSAPWRDSLEFDCSNVCYLKIKDSAEKFAVVQFGLCTFRWDACQGSFIAHPLNFYIFPRNEQSVEGSTDEFLCQTTSLSFLAKYQFDFNACINEGISYLSRTQEAEAQQNLCSVSKIGLPSFSDDSDIPAVRTVDLLFIERMKIKFHEWRHHVLKYPEFSILNGNNSDSNVGFQTVFFKMHPAIMLNGFTSHRLKLIQLVIRKHFKDLVYICVSGEKCSLQKFVVYTDSEEDRASLMQEVKEDQLGSGKAKIHSAVGFRHVIDLLSSERKLIVGHSCFLDLAHIYKKFVGPLPSSMEEFALSVNKIFPNVVDTKHIISSNHVVQLLMKKRRSLSSAFSLLCPQVYSPESRNSNSSRSFVKINVQADEAGSASSNSSAKHEAGFDAFMTGCVFAQCCSHLGIKFEQAMDLIRNENLTSYINVLQPSLKSGTVIELSTGLETPSKAKHPEIDYASAALIWGFSSDLKPHDVQDCLRSAFGTASVVSVCFIDRSAALVQFNKMELVKDFLALKHSLEEDKGPVPMLHPLAKLLLGGKTHAAGYDAYKKICGSPNSKALFAEQAEANETGRKKMKPVSKGSI